MRHTPDGSRTHRQCRGSIVRWPSSSAKSVSAWLNAAARDRMEDEDLAEVLAELFAATGGQLTDAELTRARQRLTHAEH